jgi:maltose O-acetyltransferase
MILDINACTRSITRIGGKLLGIMELCSRWMRKRYWKVLLSSLGDNSNIAGYVVIKLPRRVKIGSNVTLNEFTHIWAKGGVEIGDDSIIASHCVITTQTHLLEAAQSGQLFRETNSASPIKIGSNVWIGARVTILPGVTIGSNSVIGANSLVTVDVPDGVIAYGSPARIIRKIVE